MPDQPPPHDASHAYYLEFIAGGTASEAELERFVELLWQEHGRRVFATIQRIVRDREEAADLTQETFVNAWKWLQKRERPSKPPHFGAWLTKIGRNAAFARMRTGRLDVVQADSVPEPVDPSEPPLVDRLAKIESLKLCLERLSAADRELVIQVDLQGFKPIEVARQMRRSPESVRVQLFRAREQLRDCLQQHLH